MARDWETCYQLGNIPWDKGFGAPPLREVISRMGVEVFAGGSVLVPGCGLGHVVRLLAEHGVRAYGLDLSETAVRQARSLDASGLGVYHYGDFLEPKWADGRCFSAIWEHTCYCAIHPTQRVAYATACSRVLQPGGILAGVFFLDPHRGPNPDEPPFPTSISELDLCFSPWFQRLAGWEPEFTYPGREGREWIGVYRKQRDVSSEMSGHRLCSV